MPYSFSHLLAFVIQILIVLIITEAIIANIIAFGGRLSPYHPFVRTVRTIVNPILEPFRRLLPPHKTQGWDLSPMIAIILLQIIGSYLW
jgi:YggT family protein